MLILIDTSQETGLVALIAEGQIAAMEENKIAREHASWLHAALGRILLQTGKTLRDLQAVAVIAGPGSYTGLRVAMAAGKFHGVTRSETPIGWFSTRIRFLFVGAIASSPGTRTASSANQRKNSAA